VPMRLLVIGAGSIGARHLNTAAGLGWSVAVVRRPGSAQRPRQNLPADTTIYEELRAAIDAFKPNGAIVASPTALHIDAARVLVERGIPTLIEKPLSNNAASAEQFAREHDGRVPMGVACNLRFWPALTRMRAELASVGQVLSVRVQVGQHLSQWRPGTDYHTSYSAQPQLGGGVLLDLIHEIDYLLWTFGMPTTVIAEIVRTGALAIESEDLVAAVFRWPGGSLGELHLDYLRHHPRRSFEVIGATATMAYDTDRHRLERWTEGGVVEVLHAGKAEELADTYAAQLHNLRAVIEGKESFRTSVEDGVRALKVVDAIRQAATTHATVTP
jgi:predicted dehydrogenase